jgi:phosphoribosylformylglycinamidine synthase subunit PurL
MCAIDPYLGMVATVCEAVRNVACTGARPAGITNCLNYGNPERPEIMWQLVRGIEGLRDAATAFETPVISGNVSLYNETEGRAIPPTPTIAVVGILDRVARHVKQYLKNPGDAILSVSTGEMSLASSEYAALFGANGALGPIDLGRERKLMDGLVECAGRGWISSAHDVAEGGFAVALAEACFNPDGILGAEVKLEAGPEEVTRAVFGEGASMVIISAPRDNIEIIRKTFVPLEVRLIGLVNESTRLRIAGLIDEDVRDLKRLYEEALPGRLGANE